MDQETRIDILNNKSEWIVWKNLWMSKKSKTTHKLDKIINNLLFILKVESNVWMNHLITQKRQNDGKMVKVPLLGEK